MDDLDRKAKELEEEMRKEAARRLKLLKPDHPALAEQFLADGTVYVQDMSFYAREDYLFRKADGPEMDVVHYMEDEQGNLPYFIIKSSTNPDSTPGVVYFFLYVGYDKNNWRLECYSYEKFGRTIAEPYVYEVQAGFRTEDDESPIQTLLSKFSRLTFDLGKANSDGQI